MTIPRCLERKLKNLFEQFPVVTLTGPRQSGKTTLVREIFSELDYVNLERTLDREFAESEPESFLKQFKKGAIIDEVQRVPELLSNIQVLVDERGEDSQFVLTGSHNPTLLKYTTQSLAGRTSLSKLLPFSFEEIVGRYSFSLEEQILKGFYPRSVTRDISNADFYGNYVETYVQRDVSEIINVKNRSLFIKFLRLCAGRVGQLLNKDDLSRDVGISPSTVEQWLSILEASYIIYRLRPWHSNMNKRVIKSPKLYFYDVGLASYLMGITRADQITTHPLKGGLFENLQVMEALKWIYNHEANTELFFIRDSKNIEIDLLIKQGENVIPIEIKSASRFDKSFLKGFKLLEDMDFKSPWGRFLVLGVEKSQQRGEVQIVGFRDLYKNLSEYLLPNK